MIQEIGSGSSVIPVINAQEMIALRNMHSLM